MTPRGTVLEALLAKVRRALDERGKPDVQERLLREVLAELRTHGAASAYVHWCLAGALDQQGRLEMAFEELKKALQSDPLALPLRTAFQDVASRLRAALADPARAADDEATPRLYALLVEAGEADLDAHVAMTRHAVATGQLARARALAEAVVTLFPAAALAWEVLARVATAQGDAAAVARAEAERALLAAPRPLFAVPGEAKA